MYTVAADDRSWKRAAVRSSMEGNAANKATVSDMTLNAALIAGGFCELPLMTVPKQRSRIR